MKLYIYAFLILLLMATAAHADEFRVSEIIIHATSYHSDRAAHYNEANPGAGLIVRKGDAPWFLTVGGYYNSLYRPTVYAGAGYELASVGPFYLRATAGIVTGYTVPVAPALIPEVGVRFGRVGIAMHYMPRIESIKVAEVFAFSLTYKF